MNARDDRSDVESELRQRIRDLEHALKHRNGRIHAFQAAQIENIETVARLVAARDAANKRAAGYRETVVRIASRLMLNLENGSAITAADWRAEAQGLINFVRRVLAGEVTPVRRTNEDAESLLADVNRAQAAVAYATERLEESDDD
jgi:hypothetical protein